MTVPFLLILAVINIKILAGGYIYFPALPPSSPPLSPNWPRNFQKNCANPRKSPPLFRQIYPSHSSRAKLRKRVYLPPAVYLNRDLVAYRIVRKTRLSSHLHR